ncbi:37S ribosomal protein S7, mitochondrial [Daldinia childiae]|uniref:37S ribosomal protein S7, mitochondrial n=1 Tax=Daldinia childiae TaxID=326645 RepID=UPI001445A521|nr:37S ribosomal protein S7, mitochondrial [Daldinia childiae]KAF3054958.1 37S ribosomal protein S7, mitochondrial [Daldinia childiae]
MSCKLTPWGTAAATVRNLSIRTRRAPTTAFRIPSHPEQRPTYPTPFLITRRGLSDDTNTRIPPSPPPQSETPPPTPAEYVPKPPELFAPNFLNAEAIAALEKAAANQGLYDDDDEGLLFNMPDRVGKGQQLQDRYHPVVEQVTKLLMKDGKLSQAQRNMAMILNYLRTTPAPKVSPLRPLLPGSPPADQLPLNPLLYLTLAIDSVAPLIRIRSLRGAAGGGQSLDLPQPMAARARRRIAVMWILDAVRRKRSAASGRAQFATRFAQELVAVVEGKSTVWDKRNSIHKLGTAARANLTHHAVVGKRRK